MSQGLSPALSCVQLLFLRAAQTDFLFSEHPHSEGLERQGTETGVMRVVCAVMKQCAGDQCHRKPVVASRVKRTLVTSGRWSARTDLAVRERSSFQDPRTTGAKVARRKGPAWHWGWQR